jgi:hypothetical protein
LTKFYDVNYQDINREQILRRRVDARILQSRTPDDLRFAQTLALIQKSLEVDAELASTTHEGARQLMAALGLLPRNVNAPEWIQFGIGSFFETPKGAPWGGAGGPNWLYLPQYKDWFSKRELARPWEELKNVVTDRNFRMTNAGKDEAKVLKARTMAWSLTFFLMQKRLDGLMEYYRELSRLPRDMDFDGDTLLLVFATAFKCLDNKGKPDETQLARLANDWRNFIDLTPLEGQAAVNEVRKSQNELKTGGVGAPATGSQPGDVQQRPGGQRPGGQQPGGPPGRPGAQGGRPNQRGGY